MRFFLLETAPKRVPRIFSGLRMRDGTPAQPCAPGTYASWTARVSRGAAGARKCHWMVYLQAGDITFHGYRTGLGSSLTTGWCSCKPKTHAEIGLFPKGNGVGTVFSEFSGLRMRDGAPAQPCAPGTYASWNARVSRGAAGARKCVFFSG